MHVSGHVKHDYTPSPCSEIHICSTVQPADNIRQCERCQHHIPDTLSPCVHALRKSVNYSGCQVMWKLFHTVIHVLLTSTCDSVICNPQ